jgi:hypothetical protein
MTAVRVARLDRGRAQRAGRAPRGLPAPRSHLSPPPLAPTAALTLTWHFIPTAARAATWLSAAPRTCVPGGAAGEHLYHFSVPATGQHTISFDACA